MTKLYLLSIFLYLLACASNTTKLTIKDINDSEIYIAAGSAGTKISNTIFTKIKQGNFQKELIEVGSAGGYEEFETKRVSDLTVVLNRNSLNYKNIYTRQLDFSTFIKMNGVFGSDIARAASVNIDFLNGRFELKPY